MKRALILSFCTLLAIGCEGTASDENYGEPYDVASSTQELGSPPTNPVLVVPTVPTAGINGARASRLSLEPHIWQACISQTTATCSTGSGGVGAVCGISALCNTDLFCIGGVCMAPVGLGGACPSNAECGAYSGTPLVCILGTCLQYSGLLGPCDEPADCVLPPGSGAAVCVLNLCRPLGDIGAPCQNTAHCKNTGSGGQPLTCFIPSGSTAGTCQVIGGPGAPCTDEVQCTQSTAPRCIPTTPSRTCALSGGDNAPCDDKPDCNQATAPTGRECVASLCKVKGTVGTPCTLNSECLNSLVCINGSCNSLSATGGACDETLDCTQTQQQGCLQGICRVTGLLNGPCGTPNEFCGANSACNTAQNPSGGMLCIGTVCLCPSTDVCYENADCALTSTGAQSVCVPRIAPSTGKVCRPAGTTPTGCCDEKADCRPIGASTCLLSAVNLGCNSGGECRTGLSQGATCSTSDQCTGVLVCKINTLVPGRNYTTCEYP
jgi:hypothetical protein